jgi:hypothetical protein
LEVKHFHVPARRSKTPENALSEKETLDHLAKVAGNVRFHFKAFQDSATVLNPIARRMKWGS